jgi:hypothetical protein
VHFVPDVNSSFTQLRFRSVIIPVARNNRHGYTRSNHLNSVETPDVPDQCPSWLLVQSATNRVNYVSRVILWSETSICVWLRQLF